LVITVPAIFPEKSKAIMRNCAFKAGLIKEEDSANLQFTTERENLKKDTTSFDSFFKLFLFIYLLFLAEAAAIYCMDDIKQQSIGSKF